MTQTTLDLFAVRAFSVGLIPSKDLTRQRRFSFSHAGQDVSATIEPHRYCMWNRDYFGAYIDLDCAHLGDAFLQSPPLTDDIKLTEACIFIDQHGMALMIKRFSVDVPAAGLELAAINDIHFSTGRTSQDDAAFYDAVFGDRVTRQVLSRTDDLWLDYVSPTSEGPDDRTHRDAFFDDLPWRACHFVMGEADAIEMPSVDHFEYAMPLQMNVWWRGQVSRVTDQNGIYAWRAPMPSDGHTLREWTSRLYPFSLPIIQKASADAARTNALSYTARFVSGWQPNKTEVSARNYMARYRLKQSHYHRLRSFLSSTQKVVHDVNLEYYQIEKEGQGLDGDFRTLKAAIDANIAISSERFARSATILALVFTGLSFVTTVTAVITFYLDDKIANTGFKLTALLGSASLGVLAVILLLYIVRRK
ncbi:hypothetical protein [Shimia ponticola]|uniref:hypothetical protein n=1 Tax=Shimia ponticola TaxID=2582893 RepID=UPI0011BFD9A4|nr:hypothetical protein [Shimia ponticola]